MSYQSYRQRLDTLLNLIATRQLISARFGAGRLNCCPRTVKGLISRLRKEGHEIRYDKALKRYVLSTTDGESTKEIDNEKSQNNSQP